MPRTPWSLSDFSTGAEETYLFPINPNTFTPPGKKAGITWQRTTAPNGQVLVWQGINDPGEGSMSGAVNDAVFYAELNEWAAKWYPVFLVDDRSNSWEILITEVSWTRKNRHIYPDSYDYTIKFLEMA
jgi:hypothetical protein